MMEFKYPLAPSEGKEYTAEELYGKLSQENSGYYLLSANGFWHGGVHFSNKHFSEEMPVQAIADGTVIAYRINKEDLIIPDNTVIAEKVEDQGYKYSSGFCLIRHTYTSPEVKPTTQEEMDQWDNREIALQTPRNARNIEGLALKEDTDYMVTLPKEAKLDVISTGNTVIDKYYFTKVKTKQVLKGTSKANKEVEVAIGTELYIAAFKGDGSMVTYQDQNKKSANLFQETDTPEKWQDRLIQLSQETQSYKDAEKTAYEKLPANTKLQLLETSNTEGKLTKAKLLYDINVTPEKEPTILKKDQELWIELFDDKGQVKQEDDKPIVTDTPTATPSLYTFFFYSLYMHLCSYNDYIVKKDEDKEEDKPEVITINAKGLSVRDKNRDDTDSKVVGKISDKATLEVIETKEAGKGVYTYVKGKILTGEVTKDGNVVLKKDDIVWVPTRENKKSYIEAPPAKTVPKEKTRPSYWEGKVTAQVKNKDGIDIFEKTDNTLTKLATINVGNRFTFNSTEVKTITHNGKPTLFAECTKIGELTFRAKGEQVDTFWTTVDTKNSIIREQVEPLTYNLVVPCKAEITAGEALGYLGVYETPSPSFGCDLNKKRQVHVEVFTPDPLAVQYLLNNPLKLTDGKQFLRLPAGTGLFDKPVQQTLLNAPQMSPAPSYKLEQDHVFAIDKVTVEKDVDETEWYLIGAEKHSGRVQKTPDSPEIVSQHEWAKLGFKEVKEVNPKSDGYLDPKLMPAIFQQIYQKIDSNGDGKLEQSELKTALKDPELREQWSKLIAYHPSEWQMDTRALLARFATLLTNPEAPAEAQANAQKLLVQETLRINTLTFLEQVAPPIPPMLYHFHPVAFVEYNQGEIVSEITVEYHIYHGGNIKYKLLNVTGGVNKTDSELINERKIAKYVYYDENNNAHKLGTYKIDTVKNLYPTANTYKDKLGGNKVYLMDMREITTYHKKINDLVVQFTMSVNTNRYYANDVTAASLLGAMLNTGFTDFVYNGCSNEKGQSIGGSQSHKNGMHLDMRYLRLDKSGERVYLDLNGQVGDPCGWKGLDVDRQNDFIEELTRFGWTSKLSWKYWTTESSSTVKEWKAWYEDWKKANPDQTELPVLKNVKHFENHNHHIHLQGYAPNLEKL